MLEFNHGKWKVKLVPKNSRCLPNDLDGTCDEIGKRGTKWVYVCRDLSAFDLLETILHESGHAANPLTSEETIEQQAHQQAKLLVSLGYQRVPSGYHVVKR